MANKILADLMTAYMVLDRHSQELLKEYMKSPEPLNNAVAACAVSAEDIKEATDRIITLARGHHIRNADGTIDPKRRLDCMCCPLAYYRKRIDYFRRYPGMVRAYCRAAERYRQSHPDVETVGKYGDVYEWFTREVFFERQSYWEDHKTVTQFTPPITTSF